MFEEHPSFKSSLTEDSIIWRYLDFTKFVSILQYNTIHFTRSDMFDDPFEGSWTKRNFINRMEWLRTIPNFEVAISKDKLGNIYRNMPRRVAVNCWHANEHESAAMWQLYLKSNEGIAIRSTIKKLKQCIIDPKTVYIGEIKYIDYDSDEIETGNLLNPFLYKRKSFEHEKELRALFVKWPTKEENFEDSKGIETDGVAIIVDPNILIDKIFIAPNAPPWFANLVRKVIETYHFRFEVVQSSLSDGPVF